MKVTRRNRVRGTGLNPMQRAVEDFLDGHSVVAVGLASLVASELEKQGATGIRARMDWLESEVRKRLLNEGGLGWEQPFNGDFPELEGNYSVSFDAADLQLLAGATEGAVEAAVQRAVDSFFTQTLEDVRAQGAQAVERREKELMQFRGRLADRWDKPLRLLATELGVALQFGSDMTEWLRSQASDTDSALVEALLRLHARACQTAGEVEVLLQAGFADGALSRWRTLHEVTVVAMFLQEHGDDVAQRYLDHLAIDSFDMARKYRAACEPLVPCAMDDDEMEELEAEARALKAKYGKEFAAEYGWAAAALRNPNPKFSHIEQAVDFAKLRPFYKLASNTVHAGPKGAFWKLGLSAGEQDMLLAGPSNAGLAEAGRLTAMSLAHVSMTLMMVHTVVDSTVWTRVILQLSREAGEEFLRAERKLLDEEGRLRPRRVWVPARLHRYQERPEKLSARLRRRFGG